MQLFAFANGRNQTRAACAASKRAIFYTNSSRLLKGHHRITKLFYRTKFLFNLEYNKILVGLGFKDIFGTPARSFEVIDLASEQSNCSLLPSYPLSVTGAALGMSYQNEIMGCGGNGTKTCQTLTNGSWVVAAPTLVTARQAKSTFFSPENYGNGRMILATGSGSAVIMSLINFMLIYKKKYCMSLQLEQISLEL